MQIIRVIIKGMARVKNIKSFILIPSSSEAVFFDRGWYRRLLSDEWRISSVYINLMAREKSHDSSELNRMHVLKPCRDAVCELPRGYLWQDNNSQCS